ncbi:MAG: RNA polymerase sigma factor RpoH [Gammaproteobacteria bacterium]|nr:RNA polymerase sigma factor RpoH [Gammaproteobacteria bacterium]
MANNFPLAVNLNTENGLAHYFQLVNQLPALEAEEEFELATRYQSHGDLDAVRQLILSQLHSVVRIARKFTGYGLPQADLIQEGNIGLMKAVKHFDPSRGVRLVSFAVHWIRAEIYDYILRNWRIVKVATTKAQRKLFFNLRKARTRLGWMNQDEIKALANDLDVPEKTVTEMESRMSGQDIAFDMNDSDDDDYFQASPAGYLQDMRYNPEVLANQTSSESDQEQQIHLALAELDDRSRDIVTRRWLNDDKATLHELADEYGVSAERIRQLEKKAMAKMKQVMLA